MLYIMRIKNNEYGFTLVELLVSFSVLLVVCASLPLLLKSLHNLTFTPVTIHPLELDVFVQQVNNEIRAGKELYVVRNVLTIVNNDDEKITYEYYQNRIRRRVNGTGHVIALQNVFSFFVTETSNGAILQITGLNGEKYEINVHKWTKGVVNDGAWLHLSDHYRNGYDYDCLFTSSYSNV